MKVTLPKEVHDMSPEGTDLYVKVYRSGYLSVHNPRSDQWSVKDADLWPEAYNAGLKAAMQKARKARIIDRWDKWPHHVSRRCTCDGSEFTGGHRSTCDLSR